jgi:hypothetical protein
MQTIHRRHHRADIAAGTWPRQRNGYPCAEARKPPRGPRVSSISPVTDGAAIARGLLGAADIGGGPTPEQVRVVQGLLDGYFGVDVDASSLDPLAPTVLAAVVDAADTKRVVDLIVVVEYCRHGDDGDAQAQRAEEYAAALGVDEPFLVVARDALEADQQRVMADWARYYEVPRAEPGAPVADAALATRLRNLSACAPGTLGRAFFDFYDRWQLRFPGEEGGGEASLVSHDFSHVIAGYEPDPPSEIALQAMLVSATGFEHHFSGLIASLSLFETGTFDIDDITPKTAALDRPGAAVELGEAFRRGQACTRDFSALDHLARVDDQLDDVRRDCGIPARG